MATEKIPEIRVPQEEQSNEPILASHERILVGGIWLDLIDMGRGESPFQIKDGKISLDKKKFEEEREKVTKALAESIEKGDRKTFDDLTRGLSFSEDEERVQLYISLQELFRDRNPQQLDAINVDFLVDGIAQRNIMREGLKPQFEKLPFSFMDSKGNRLDPEKDMDVVFVKDKGGDYKLIVASKKGIDEIVVPESIRPDQFQPDFLKMEKDAVTDTITIPLKPARDRSESYVVSVEIRKGAIDLPKKLAKEEAEEQAKKARKKKEEDSYYNPPPARTPRRSSESGGYGYTSVSG